MAVDVALGAMGCQETMWMMMPSGKEPARGVACASARAEAEDAMASSLRRPPVRRFQILDVDRGFAGRLSAALARGVAAARTAQNKRVQREQVELIAFSDAQCNMDGAHRQRSMSRRGWRVLTRGDKETSMSRQWVLLRTL